MIDNFITMVIPDESGEGKLDVVYSDKNKDGVYLTLKLFYTLVDDDVKDSKIDINIGKYNGENDIYWVKRYIAEILHHENTGVVISGKHYRSATVKLPKILLDRTCEEGIYVIYSKLEVSNKKRTSIDYFELKYRG